MVYCVAQLSYHWTTSPEFSGVSAPNSISANWGLFFKTFQYFFEIGLMLRPTIKVVDSDFSFPDSADQQTNNRCWPDSGHNYIIRKKFLSVNHRSPSRFPSLVVALSDEWRLYSETSCLLFLFVSFLNINITENSCEEKIRFSDL